MIAFTTPKCIKCSTADGHNVVIESPIVLRRDDGAFFQVPVGAESDGASTPRAMWPEIPPFGDHWRACVVHDSAYRGTLLRQTVDGAWVQAMLPKEECDLLLLDCMMADGVDQVKRNAIYDGVKLFAWRAFREDRK
jgi:hypothetical protein